MTTPDSPPDDFTSPEAFFANVDVDQFPQWSTADELANISMAAFIEQQNPSSFSSSRALVRLHGPAVQGNAISVRKATRVLGALQDALSAVAAALRGERAGLRGRIPEAARLATELRLVAEPMPGSVVLKLAAGDTRSPSDTNEPPMLPASGLADRSMHQMLKLVRRADVLDHSQLLEEIRPLGPRVARQFVKLAEAVIDDDVLVDLTWHEHGREPDRAKFSRSSALIIRDSITDARVDVDEVRLTGILQTISQFRALDLLTESGERIALEASDETRTDLGPLYGKQVEVTAEVIVRTSGTGQDRARYRLLSVRPIGGDETTPAI